jgi:hypothetical protein
MKLDKDFLVLLDENAEFEMAYIDYTDEELKEELEFFQHLKKSKEMGKFVVFAEQKYAM